LASFFRTQVRKQTKNDAKFAKSVIFNELVENIKIAFYIRISTEGQAKEGHSFTMQSGEGELQKTKYCVSRTGVPRISSLREV